MKRNESFDKVAKTYDEVRPSYPEKLINDIIEKTNLKTNDRLLEVGAGTGKATIQLAEKGFNIHCVELGEKQAEILRDKCSNYPEVTVDVDSFEQWETTEHREFGLIYSAQAFHWIDPEIKYKKCHSLLKEKGHIALFWYQPSDEVTEIGCEINSMMKKYVPDFSNDEVKKDTHIETIEMRKSEIISSGLFKNVQVFEYVFENKLDTEKYIKVFESYSKFAILDDNMKSKLRKEIESIVNNHGGYVKSKLIFSLFIGEKIGDGSST